MTGFRIKEISGDIADAFYAARSVAFPSAYNVVAETVTDTMHDAADILKSEGRASIAGGGFSKKWQNAWRVDVYPKHGVSINAAVYGHHKIPYASLFETGGVIHAKSGLLWLALPNVPKVNRARATPKQLSARGIKLFSIKRPGKKPLLATNVRMSKSAARRIQSTVRGRRSLEGRVLSLARLKRSAKRGVNVTIPLFFGVPAVTIRKRFDLEGVARKVEAQLGALYEKNAE